MPYVNIPETNLPGGVAKIVGKMAGTLAEKISKAAAGMVGELRAGLLSNARVAALRNKHNKLKSNISKIQRRVEKFNKMAKTLLKVITGLEVALKIILAIPIPQAFPHVYVGPPGLPVSVSNKYADILHKIKELIKQIKDAITAILLICELPNFLLSFLTRMLDRMDNALKSMEIRIALEEELRAGRLKREELEKLGLLDENGVFIFSRLEAIFVGKEGNDALKKACNLYTIDNYQFPPFGRKGQYHGIIEKYKFVSKDVPPTVPFKSKAQLVKLDGVSLQWDGERWKCYGEDEATKELEKKLKDIQDSNLSKDIKDNIRSLLARLKDLNKQQEEDPNKWLHRGPNGTVYRLEILPDPDDPPIAPRHFAQAKNMQGVVMLKGPKSFSSDVDVLLDEIKFRIDNQLP